MRKSTQTTWLLVLLVVVAVIAGFLLLDFKVAGSRTNLEKQSEKYGFGVESGQALPQKPDVGIFVAGHSRLSGELRDALQKDLQGLPEFSNIALLSEPLEQYPSGLLQVIIQRRGGLWTPFLAFADLDVDLYFSSDGDLTWIDQDVVRMENGQPAVRLHSQISLRDRTFGIISRPAYDRHLAEAVSEPIKSELTGAVNRPAGP